MKPALLFFAALACNPEPAQESGSQPADTDTTGDTAADTGDTAPDTGNDSGDTGDTASDTGDSGDTGPSDGVCPDTPAVMLYDAASATWSDWTHAIPTVPPAVPVAMNAPGGEVRFCGGTWYAYMTVEAAGVTIAGEAGAVVDANGQESVVRVGAGADALTIRGVTLTGGDARTATSIGGIGGGGIFCDSAATLTLEDVTVSGNSGNSYGGGLFINGCTVGATGLTVTDNDADSAGGGLFISDATVSISESTIRGNTSAMSGAGLYAAPSSAAVSLTLHDTVVEDNVATGSGGGLAMGDGGRAGTTISVTCSASPGVRAGFFGNSAARADLPGGGVYVVPYWGNPLSFSAASCDFGAEGSADDNSPSDVFVYGRSSFDYGDDASFTCGATGCG